MTEPVSGGKGPSITDEQELMVDGVYNPLLASVLSGGLATSSAEIQKESVQIAIPQLSTPLADNLYQKMTLEQSEVVTRVAERWTEEMEEQREVREENFKKEDRIEGSVKRKKEELASHEASHKAWHQTIAALLGLYRDPTISTQSSEGKQIDKVELSSAMTSSLMIGAGFIGSFEPGNKVPSQGDQMVIQEMWARVAVGHNPSDIVSQSAGWISALWGVGVSYFTAAEQMVRLEELTRNPVKDLDFAVSFAQNLVKALSTPEFANQMRVIVLAHLPGAEKINSKDIEKLGHMGKIILLSMALALIMKLELGASFKEKVYEGHITGEEFLGMLNGELDFQTDDPQGLALVKARLVVQINLLLSQLPAGMKQELLGNLKAYLNTNPALENLSNPNHVVRKIFGANNLSEARLEQHPV